MYTANFVSLRTFTYAPHTHFESYGNHRIDTQISIDHKFIEFLQANVAGGQTEYKLTVCRQPVGEGASLDLDGWF